ncbi:MAG: sigma-54 dependent transcriptional regulator, partial [bacterium]|nr:sigma-54 dependent transcriptional regulator [bacterium]
GAFDFLEKPIEKNKLIILIKNLTDIIELKDENRSLKTAIQEEIKIIGESPGIKEIHETIKKIAPSDSSIFIQGENGSGKDLIARAIHFNSNRKKKNFIEVNCAAIPDELIESELFGYEEGAFTNANARKKGKLELADGGTLFLDEIGDMSLLTQAKVLRVLQFGEFERLGGIEKISVNIRVIAATNKDIRKEIAEKKFREDLYFRLNVIPIFVPPLRERSGDIPVLTNFFADEFFNKNAVKKKEFSKDVLDKMVRYSWPGNVRELRNIIERLIIMSDSKVIDMKDFEKYSMLYQVAVIEDKDDYSNLPLKDYIMHCEKRYIQDKLEKANWNITKAAKFLGIQRPNLYKKLEQLNIKIKK